MNWNDVSSWLDRIREKEGDAFTVDESKVKEEFNSLSTLYSNLPVKVLSVLGGLLASIALTGFLILAHVFESDSATITVGMLFIAGSVIWNRAVNSVVLDAGTTCIYLLGYGMLYFQVFESSGNGDWILYIFLAVSAAVILVSESYMLVFLSALIFMSAFAKLLYNGMGETAYPLVIVISALVYSLLTINETRIIAAGKRGSAFFNPVQKAFLTCFAAGLAFISLSFNWEIYIPEIPLVSFCIWTGIITIVWNIVTGLRIEKPVHKILVCVFCVVCLWPTYHAPGIGGALFILLMARYYGHKTELAFGVLLLCGFVIQYYYDLKITLLVKSGILVLSGLLFIGAWILFRKLVSVDEKD